MKWCIVFLHGEQILIGIALAGILVLVGLPLLLYIWLWRTKISELKLAIGYFSIVALPCLILMLDSDSHSGLILALFSLSFILTLPWNVLGNWLLGTVFNSPLSDPEFAVIMICGALLNSLLLYFAASKMRRLVR